MNSRLSPTLGMVVLAAGFSARLGQPKALATVRGRSLLNRTLDGLAPFSTGRILVIVPPGAARYRIGISARSVVFATNRRPASGLSGSVHLGVRRSRYCSAVLLLPVDLVDLETKDLRRLIARWRGSRRRLVARRIGGRAGTPLILPRGLFALAAACTGDEGLREVIARLPDSALSRVPMPSAQFDVDTPGDLALARRRRRPTTLPVPRPG